MVDFASKLSKQKELKAMSDLGKYSLDSSLDDIEDLPSFAPWPTGGYKAGMKVTEKTINDKSNWEIVFTCTSVVELFEKDTLEFPKPKPGDTVTVLYQQNENGFRALKKVLAVIGSKFNKKQANECIGILEQGVDVLVILKRDWNEERKRNYMRIQEYSLA